MPLDLETEVHNLFRAKMIEFIEWSKENWTITDKDLEKPDDWFAGKSPEYREGYNAALDGLDGAFECWNEEFGP